MNIKYKIDEVNKENIDFSYLYEIFVNKLHEDNRFTKKVINLSRISGQDIQALVEAESNRKRARIILKRWRRALADAKTKKVYNLILRSKWAKFCKMLNFNESEMRTKKSFKRIVDRLSRRMNHLKFELLEGNKLRIAPRRNKDESVFCEATIRLYIERYKGKIPHSYRNVDDRLRAIDFWLRRSREQVRRIVNKITNLLKNALIPFEIKRKLNRVMRDKRLNPLNFSMLSLINLTTNPSLLEIKPATEQIIVLNQLAYEEINARIKESNGSKVMSQFGDKIQEFNRVTPFRDALMMAGLRPPEKGGKYKDKISCPFHPDTSPSFHVYENHGHCYSCGTTAYSYQLLRQTIGEEEARKIVDERVTTFTPRPAQYVAPEPPKCELPSKEILEQNESKKLKYMDLLYDDSEAVVHLMEIRKISQKILKKFSIGCSRSAQDGELRITIPHITEENETIGLIINRPHAAEKDPKYINDRYPKNYRPFGDFQLEVQDETIIFTEGVYDCMNAHGIGLVNCVATLGAGINPENILKYAKKRGAKKIILAFDNDKAGKKSTEDMIKHQCMNDDKVTLISVFDLKEHKDLDDYIKAENKVPTQMSPITWMLKEIDQTIESNPSLREYNMRNYHEHEVLIKKFPWLKKMDAELFARLTKNINTYISGIKTYERDSALHNRSIIWHETSHRRNDDKMEDVDRQILDFDFYSSIDTLKECSSTGQRVKLNDDFHRKLKARTSTFNLIIGDTGTGKSTFAMHLMALNNMKPYKQIIISLEMHCGHLFSMATQFFESYEKLNNNEKPNIEIIQSSQNIHMIKELIFKRKKEYPDIKVVYIDHIHLIKTSRPDETNPMNIVANELMQLAQILDICIIGLAQLNREASKQYSPPQTHDIRDSSSLENNASFILGLFNPGRALLCKERVSSMSELSKDKMAKYVSLAGILNVALLKNRHGNHASPVTLLRQINEVNGVKSTALWLVEPPAKG